MTMTKTQLLLASITLAGALASPINSFAAKYQCRNVFISSNETKSARLEEQLSELNQRRDTNYQSLNIKTYGELLLFSETFPSIKTIDGGNLYKNLIEILSHEEKSMEHGVIRDVLKLTLTNSTDVQLRENLQKNFTSVLSNIYGPALAKKMVTEKFNHPERIDAEFMAVSFKEAYKGIIGDPEKLLKLNDSQTAEASTNEAKTVMDLFMAEAKEALGGQYPQTFKSTFAKGPAGSPNADKSGPERIYIALDSRTAPLHAKYFLMSNPQILTHFHTNLQGTLMVTHMGMNMTYARHYTGVDANRYGSNVGLIMPAMVFSSSEGSRLKNYFDLGALTNTRNKYGWAFVNKSTNDKGETQIDRYCSAVGGYKSCTHWFGDIPVGDQIVKSFTFPGNADMDPYGTLISPEIPDALKHLPRTGKIKTYNSVDTSASTGGWFSNNSLNITSIENESRVDRLTRIVWQQNQSPAQMWKVLDLKDSQIGGELANPGYVLYSLLGSADNKRVPVVFIVREDATRPFTQNEIEELRSRINAF